jgi:hypothetical protein
MRRDNLLKHALIGFGLAAVIYLGAYTGIEYLRTRKGGWEVTFRSDSEGRPQVEVAQPTLGIANVKVHFPDERLSQSNLQVRIIFDRPVTNVPFGKVLYLDTTFLPGAIAFGLFGHEVQLMPRSLLLDRRPGPWQSGATHELHSNVHVPQPRPPQASPVQ